MNPETRVLITGASGFIGQYLAHRWAEAGAEVIGLTRRGRRDTPALTWRTVNGLSDRGGIRAALEGVTMVVHLAGRVHSMDSEDPEALSLYRQVNVDGTRVILEEARDAGVGNFAFTSTVKVVGSGARLPIDERTPARPLDPYGRSKLEAEELVLGAAADAFRTSVLRLPLVYGPGVKANMLALFRWVERGMPLPFGAIDNRRSFLFVGNLTHALEGVLHARPRGRIYFVSDGDDQSTPALVRKIGAAVGRKPVLLPVPVPILRALGRAGDLLDQVASSPITTGTVERLAESLTVDTTRLSRETGYAPPYSVQEGLDATARWRGSPVSGGVVSR